MISKSHYCKNFEIILNEIYVQVPVTRRSNSIKNRFKMKIPFILILALILRQDLALFGSQDLYRRSEVIYDNITASVYQEWQSQTRIECATTCFLHQAQTCNSFLYSKSQRTCSLASLNGNVVSTTAKQYPDASSYISLGNPIDVFTQPKNFQQTNEVCIILWPIL